MSTKTKLRIKVRDRVRFHLGAHVVTGTVVEDLGMIGVGAEQLVRVEVPFTDTEPQVFAIPATFLTPAPVGARRPLSR
ncbi:MAG: hypothetical protein E6J90_06475 [Deltaproteobacteria bacterium]|nr:MAG: hypothetical protein E6J91_03115 [Deltaproteobacteria bacterium]TMQ25170.1 MAG: hypothetical protein E6J90_06475 [Deltaproteobacteria bacterium]